MRDRQQNLYQRRMCSNKFIEAMKEGIVQNTQ